MINYDSPLQLAAFLEEHGLAAQKKFGQNFLINKDARTLLITALESSRCDEVWEIGAGLGAMTAELLKQTAPVRAFELDRGFCKVLRTFFGANERFSLVEGNALHTLKTAPFNRARQIFLLGNLPYNIAAKLLGDCIEHGLLFPRMVITVQREVARRIAAQPGSEDYSSISALIATVYRVQSLTVLKGDSFYPAPHVESQALRLDLLDRHQRLEPPPEFFPLLRALFVSRRKTVKNNLVSFLKSRKYTSAESSAQTLLAASGIAAHERAERLSSGDFCRMAQILHDTESACGSF
ncbi:MAG: 16S rRNA (adenine(1518)-N(6)/adenine(1519)-N(6))-dimethyltransferase RsmA [Spirochaetaceae bacterium]|nr:16S rRNA (adenine(1518)-N(6)/adenine(1519)-N(6))-dimethyltransferase RsmA [Spirochaetaceae bacterium]